MKDRYSSGCKPLAGLWKNAASALKSTKSGGEYLKKNSLKLSKFIRQTVPNKLSIFAASVGLGPIIRPLEFL
jgi:hypothetical protein